MTAASVSKSDLQRSLLSKTLTVAINTQRGGVIQLICPAGASEQVEIRNLFYPIKIGNLRLRNRIVMPPMLLNAAEEDGSVSERMLGYYEKRAAGVGLVIVESTNILEGGEISSHQLQIHDDRYIEGLGRLSHAIKSNGAKTLIQINHGGAKSFFKYEEQRFLSASDVPVSHGQIPESMSLEEIEKVVRAFGDATERAVKAGFDGVEIQGCHFYLLSQFLSPYTNKRGDRYGGDISGRTRFIREVVEAIRGRIGPDPVISCRINGIEAIEEGLSVQEATKVGRILEDAGIDVLHVSGVLRSFDVTHKGKVFKRLVAALMKDDIPGAFVEAASQIKKAVSIPVIVAGKIFAPSLAETILREEKADLVAFGRAMLVNEEFGRILSEGQLDKLVYCNECHTCLQCLLGARSVECPLNPRLLGIQVRQGT